MFKSLLRIAVVGLACIGVATASVNINTATQDQLASLPNIGQTKAKAIVEYRKANGNFASLEDIKKVKGIGDKTFEKIKPKLSLGGEAAVAAAEPAPKAAPKVAPATTGTKKDAK